MGRKSWRVHGPRTVHSSVRMKDVDMLTPDHVLVLALVANGKTYRQIGRGLGITARAVAARVKRALDIMGVDTTHQAIAVLIDKGAIVVEDRDEKEDEGGRV